MRNRSIGGRAGRSSRLAESLVILNYDCPRSLLEPLVPTGTELDDWNGRHVVSLVGFLFRETRVKGLSIPGHREFEEVNLRFYVRRLVNGESRRAVVFVRELVPKRAIAAVARWRYDEPYLAVPMSHSVSLDPERGGEARYGWERDDPLDPCECGVSIDRSTGIGAAAARRTRTARRAPVDGFSIRSDHAGCSPRRRRGRCRFDSDSLAGRASVTPDPDSDLQEAVWWALPIAPPQASVPGSSSNRACGSRERAGGRPP